MESRLEKQRNLELGKSEYIRIANGEIFEKVYKGIKD